MKILVVSLFLPQEKAYHAGGRYVYEIIKQLALHHEISLATRYEEGEEPFLDALRPYCREIFPYSYPAMEERNLVGSFRLLCNYLAFSRYANQLLEKGDYDLAQVEWVPTAVMLKGSRVPLFLDAHDVMTKPAERAMRQTTGLARVKGTFLYVLTRLAENWIVRKCHTIFTRSENDREYLLAMHPGLRVAVSPHPAGMDITEKNYPRRPNTILFLASYKYRRLNVDAALYFHNEVLPLVRQRIADARFVIAGYGPPEELTQLAADDPLVEVPGFVDDIDRCYKEAAVFVAPILTGGGIIVKVLDALAAGTPVVTTTYGNEGIKAVSGRDLLVADNPRAFADCVVTLLTDRRLAEQMVENGRAFVREHYGLEAVVRGLENAYRAR